jgi:hypothetical protein
LLGERRKLGRVNREAKLSMLRSSKTIAFTNEGAETEMIQ